VRGYADPVIRDKISGYDDWLAWSLLAGDIDARTASTLARLAKRRPTAAARVHARALHLREALYRTFKALIQGGRPRRADVDLWSRELTGARAQQRLCARARGFVCAFPAASLALDRFLWPVALSAGELMTAGDLSKLKECGGPRCGWLFLDFSRNHSRHWCDMKDCGKEPK
jgi:predicted RNA-binding Zn ribbon-like protein